MRAAGAAGDKEQGGILWLGSCKHPSRCGRPEAKARPCVQCCRRERSSDKPAFSLWGGGQMPSRPRHSVSTSPSHCPGSAREPLCWHRTFEGSRPNKREKKGRYQHGSTNCRPFDGALDPPTRPPEAPGGPGKSSFYSSRSGNHQKPQR